jgi:hypothetical protein
VFSFLYGNQCFIVIIYMTSVFQQVFDSLCDNIMWLLYNNVLILDENTAAKHEMLFLNHKLFHVSFNVFPDDIRSFNILSDIIYVRNIHCRRHSIKRKRRLMILLLNRELRICQRDNSNKSN